MLYKKKGKAIPLQAWTGPDCSRKLKFPDFVTTSQDGGKVVSLEVCYMLIRYSRTFSVYEVIITYFLTFCIDETIRWFCFILQIINFYSYVYVFLLLCMFCSVYYVLTVPADALRLPWLRFFRAFSSVVSQMPAYNSQRWGRPALFPIRRHFYAVSSSLRLFWPLSVRIPENLPSKIVNCVVLCTVCV